MRRVLHAITIIAALGSFAALECPAAKARQVRVKVERRWVLKCDGLDNPMAWSSEGCVLAVGCENGDLLLWRRRQRPHLRRVSGQPSEVTAVEWHPTRPLLAAGLRDGTVTIWKGDTGDQVSTLQSHNESITALAWSPDGDFLVGSDVVDRVVVWDVRHAAIVREFRREDTPVSSVSWVGQSGVVALCGAGGVTLWDWRQDRFLGRMSGHHRGIFWSAWVPDSQKLITASEDRAIVWDTQTRRPLRVLAVADDYADYIDSAALAPDGARLAVGGLRSVRLWSISGPQPVRLLQGHTDWVTSLAWSPDGRWLAAGEAGEADGRVVLWDPAKRARQREFQGHKASVIRMSWSPDGSMLASGDQKGKVIIRRLKWRPPKGTGRAVE